MIGTELNKAVKHLKAGELVGIPTETVYGLAANGLDVNAVLKIFEAKERPFFDPLILHVNNQEKVNALILSFDLRLKKLADAFWPGPLTLLLPKNQLVPDIVTSGLNQVAIRIPHHPLTLSLLEQLNFPLAAPSANPFGYISPTTALHVNKQLGEKVAFILDGGACEIGLESTIVGVEEGKVCVYRLGGLSIEQLEAVVGEVTLKVNLSGDPKAPGQLKSHYAPIKPLFHGDLEKLFNQHRGKKLICLCFGEPPPFKDRVRILNLSPNCDLQEAAKNLFGFLRQADELDGDVIIAQNLPMLGLGLAINDRLKRAAVN
jgi:L-threonylcarbamoyladenylate synthase